MGLGNEMDHCFANRKPIPTLYKGAARKRNSCKSNSMSDMKYFRICHITQSANFRTGLNPFL